MAQQLTLQDAQQSLTAHIAARAAEIHQKYGPRIGWEQVQRILEDRECTRFPVEIVFDEMHLRDGEFAYPQAKTDNPEDGYRMYVHPFFSTQPGLVPALVLYQLVLVNYGDFASPSDAEIFGATVLGMAPEIYYDKLCEAADMVSAGIATAEPEPEGGGGCGSGCGCGSAKVEPEPEHEHHGSCGSGCSCGGGH